MCFHFILLQALLLEFDYFIASWLSFFYPVVFYITNKKEKIVQK